MRNLPQERLTAAALSSGEWQALNEGIALIHAGKFFEAHEGIEAAWTVCRTANRRFLQAIIHVAVGCHHQANGNRTGMQRQFRKAMAKVREYPAGHAGLDGEALWLQLEAAVSHEGAPPWDPRTMRIALVRGPDAPAPETKRPPLPE